MAPYRNHPPVLETEHSIAQEQPREAEESQNKDVEERALEAVVDHLLLQVLPDASVGLQRKTGRALRAGVNEGCPSSSDGGAPAKGIHPEES